MMKPFGLLCNYTRIQSECVSIRGEMQVLVHGLEVLPVNRPTNNVSYQI